MVIAGLSPHSTGKQSIVPGDTVVGAASRSPFAGNGNAPQPAADTMKTPVRSVANGTGLGLLPFVLSVIAGSVYIIGFLWHGLFVAHITGNLILVAARVVAGTPVAVATILSVPAFVVMLGFTNLAAVRLEAAGIPSLRPLLFVQFLFLAGCLAVGTVAGTHGPADSAIEVTALMLACADWRPRTR
jgi:hypothetical protein